jgi:hypothetical protein
LLERQFITLFANVNVYGFVKVGMKLLNIETLVTRNAILEISLNIQNFISVSLSAQCMTKLPSSSRQSLRVLPQNAAKQMFTC